MSDDAGQAAETLREILALIGSGELSAPPVMVRRLEGAVSALESMQDG